MALSTRKVVASLGLFVLVAAPYAGVLSADFIFLDDRDYVRDNPSVNQGLTLSNVRWAWITVHASNWHPLTWLSHMADATLWGPSPTGPHAINVFWHAANSVLVYWLFGRMTGQWGRSFALAALWGVHPLHVESVAWISERKTVLAAFFGLLSLLAYAAHVERGGWTRGGLTLLGFVASLLAKPMLAPLPFLMLLLDVWPLARRAKGASWKGILAEKIPFFLLSVASSIITLGAQSQARAHVAAISLPVRFFNAIYSYGEYARLTFCPDALYIARPHPLGSFSRDAVGAYLALLLAVTMVVLAARRGYLIVGWLWFLGMMTPMIGLIQVGKQGMADRYMYWPMIGLLLMVVWLAADLADRVRAPSWLRAAVVSLTIIPFARKSVDQVAVWRDSETLFRHATTMRDDNPVAWYLLGSVLRENDRPGAEEALRKAVALAPYDIEARLALGDFLATRDVNEAVEHYTVAIGVNPDSGEARLRRGAALLARGRPDWAEADLQRATGLLPIDAEAWFQLGRCRAILGRLPEGAAALARSVELDPRRKAAYLELARVTAAMGDPAAAEATLSTAMEQYPRDKELTIETALLLSNSGAGAKAVTLLDNHLLVERDPGTVRALAWILATDPSPTVREPARALTLARESLSDSPASAGEWETLAAAQAAAGQYVEAVNSARRGLDLALRDRDSRLASELRTQLALYERNQPFVRRRMAASGGLRPRENPR